ncbi:MULTISPECIES: hypothetical protein [Thiomicrorhabdus]|uniref:SPOR domain-containing protein n=1 Tax=Thiomicrorhabdus heinhorstiae TaxID=2748010 RepID=A0ABS0BYP5_9GAMM|nr:MULTISPECIES: hypothetical protein [Thiomicrorhabdus]MBF6057966.1 hypothetical protein [Thiomicrorhabdus heinhorstiae]
MMANYRKALLKIVFGVGLIAVSPSSWAWTESCQLVRQMADHRVYQLQTNRVAVMKAADKLDPDWQLELVERHGAWYIYQTPSLVSWFSKENCAPMERTFKEQKIEFMPVLFNRQTGHNAVITGTFVLKTFRAEDIEKVIERYGFKLLTRLPRDNAVIVDVKPTDSYDALIETLDRDKDVDLVAPLFSEPRYKLR